MMRYCWIAFVLFSLVARGQQSTVGGGGTATANALTNNQSTATTFAAPFTVDAGGGFDPVLFGANTGVGINGFSSGLVFRGNTFYFNGSGNTPGYGISVNGNLRWGGTEFNTNYAYFAYLPGTASMITNVNPYFDGTAHLYPVPPLAFDSYDSGMGSQANGAWSTNTIALLDTVAPNWKASGWDTIAYDDGMLTNRVSGHLTNNGAAFPQGVAVVVAYAHSHGFNIGAYVAHSQQFCGGNPGLPTIDSLIFQDVYDIGAMGFDSLKIDYCGSSTPYTDGLPYGNNDDTMEVRHFSIFPEANYEMSFKLNRKPLYMQSTETFRDPTLGTRSSAWHKYNTLQSFNAYENANPVGAGDTWKGTFTNYIYEMPKFHEVRPGHYFRINAFSGSTATDAKGYMTLAALGSLSVWARTNIVGQAAVAPYFTNVFVNRGILQHPLVQPGYVVASNSANKTVTMAKPLGPLDGAPTTAANFNQGGNSMGLTVFTNGYTTFGSSSSNAVGVFNFDSSAHTIAVTWGQIGVASNTPLAVYDVWSATPALTFVGMATNNFTTPSISAGDLAFYLFVKAPFSTTNDGVSPMSEVFIGQTGAANGGSTLHVQHSSTGPGMQIEQTSAPFGALVGLGFKTFGNSTDAFYDERRAGSLANAANFGELQAWFGDGGTFGGYFGNSWSGFKGNLGVSGLTVGTNGFAYGTGGVVCPINTNFTSYAAGTAYTLTATPAQLDFGTTDPSITIQNAGTYIITSGTGVKYNAATYAGAQTVTLKVRRTNNTASDLSNGSRTVELPVLTTFTGGDFIATPPITYTATAGDIIQLFGSVSATPSAGSVTTDSAEMMAVRIY